MRPIASLDGSGDPPITLHHGQVSLHSHEQHFRERPCPRFIQQEQGLGRFTVNERTFVSVSAPARRLGA